MPSGGSPGASPSASSATSADTQPPTCSRRPGLSARSCSGWWWLVLLPTSSYGVELERTGVDAVALARRRRAIVEHVSEVPAAAAADDCGAHHAEASVPSQVDVLCHRWL